MGTASFPLPTSPHVEQRGDSSYPTRDGRPVGESDLHRDLLFELVAILSRFYDGKKVYVSGNLLLHYEPGNKRRHVAPDVFVTLGLEPGLRLNYILWQEGLPPNMVIELTSKTTRNEDLKKKFDLYQNIIKVQEYFLFDPTADYLKPQLQGYRLEQGKYIPIEPTNGRLVCEQLGLELAAEGDSLRFFELASGRKLLTTSEELERRDAEIQRLAAEVERLRKS